MMGMSWEGPCFIALDHGMPWNFHGSVTFSWQDCHKEVRWDGHRFVARPEDAVGLSPLHGTTIALLPWNAVGGTRVT